MLPTLPKAGPCVEGVSARPAWGFVSLRAPLHPGGRAPASQAPAPRQEQLTEPPCAERRAPRRAPEQDKPQTMTLLSGLGTTQQSETCPGVSASSASRLARALSLTRSPQPPSRTGENSWLATGTRREHSPAFPGRSQPGGVPR